MVFCLEMRAIQNSNQTPINRLFRCHYFPGQSIRRAEYCISISGSAENAGENPPSVAKSHEMIQTVASCETHMRRLARQVAAVDRESAAVKVAAADSASFIGFVGKGAPAAVQSILYRHSGCPLVPHIGPPQRRNQSASVEVHANGADATEVRLDHVTGCHGDGSGKRT